ncbi:uncharacterized protein FOMMEDRAFT_171619 [Fomitiporia mediterranea MF3/22]|uniref:HNH nuclease domain-containing protein n=1 Tax=Fomitiporia mediterranea (strain MF3/22) TaxID=694068 RepID=R7SH34_FOMME|nr:uncharacterized protein FOMMEDRAFT_171619 [Fomitiporia mediterranea MF3/22]EJC97715.1 hypothetical protein FOMMEDRAFT_171619 [Fomitiporia mediterranea MF3/22]
MDVAPGAQNNAPQASSSTSGNVGEDTRVWLWYMSVGGNANPPESLLHIPHDRMRLYSLKPRKWLLYLASVILGIDGTLRFLNGDEDFTEGEMDEDVGPGDRYVFCFDGEARFLDYLLRTTRHDRSSSTSTRSRVVPSELKEYYGGCPFSHLPPGICEACHLIPFTKGDDYLHRLLASRGEPDDTMTIDDYQNQIVMRRDLHAGFDREKCVAFLKTPNKFFKTNEVPGGENALPDTYRVTVHCFLESEEQRVGLNHNAYSSMTKDCGSGNPTASRTTIAEYLPKDILLDVTYASAVINNFGTPEAKKMLEKNAHDYYPDGIVKRGEDREGKAEKEQRKRKYEGENQGRSERVVRRSRSGNNDGDHADGNGRQFDFWDGFFAMQLMIHGIRPEDIEAEEERRRRETEELNAQRIARWRKTVDESSI